MFDIGRIRNKSNTGNQNEDEKYASSFVWESWEIGMVIYKKDIKNRSDDAILDAKNYINIIFKELWINTKIIYENTSNNVYHPQKQANIFFQIGKEKKQIWFVWALHPIILKSQKISENAELVYISLNLELLLGLTSNIWESNYSYQTLQDQIVFRDLCFVTDIDKDFGEILDVVKSIKEINEVEVFDLYKWTNLPEWKKSIAFKIKILWEDMTTDKINEVMNKAIKEVEKVWWILRN
jgi:phenylalanyl-tRNA synthetase beta subunit